MTELYCILAYTLGLLTGVCGILMAMANTGRCDNCPQNKDAP